jgi:ubiquinone/menaquinone biosynthesis C-methylase UbiE
LKSKKSSSRVSAKSHFKRRARKYNQSSSWVDDKKLIRKMLGLACARREAHVLDIAIGTGKVARAFRGRVKRVVGLDISREMTQQAKACADQIVMAPAERLPFEDNHFDICVCRQGLQFMDAPRVISEIFRVLKPGGRVVLCHLAAYGARDKKETFLIQKLRNPSRKNFFLPDDFRRLLARNGFCSIESFTHLTRESVNRWTDNGAITEEAREKIRDVYKKAPPLFKKIHRVEFMEGDIFDTMKMVLVKARKKKKGTA